MSTTSESEVLARYLSDPAHAGVYRLDAARIETPVVSVSEKRGDAVAGGDWRRLPAAQYWSREALLDGLAASLAFPDHFGRNWDAAWDCLTELDWSEERALVVLVPAAPADEAAMAVFVELMRDAAEHWAARGHALVTLIVSETPVTAALRTVPEWPLGPDAR
ncbi:MULTISPECIES: barstar family protein [unclassified Halomonas]|uniref:barstar family protein n=1 Tax=unclassified Halomonas TaxID=2609666 RepID=UPI002888472E|nr:MULTISPECIES: barstar family protein [unclassified Halomonas]MDT0502368.1 barstar family protein [Halomonas sp. PAR7]MDT0510913.1 barstar family protein [Halomonas sp. LES1]MDT0592763.1 barstar family protein [Halomonas sp. PAR8]